MNLNNLIELDQVNVALDGQSVLRNISWRLQKGESWFVSGPNGSGKSTFLRLLKGFVGPDPNGGGRRTYNVGGEVTESSVGLDGKIALVSPELQMRYQRSDWNLSAEAVILTGFEDTDLLYQRPSRSQKQRTHALLSTYGLMSLRKSLISELSQGELRRILILRALVQSPIVLLLDEMSGGLDCYVRNQIVDLIAEVIRNGSQVVMTTHREDERVAGITRIAELKEGMLLRKDDPKEDLPKAGFLKQPPLPIISGIKKGLGSLSQPISIRIEKADVFRKGRKILKKINWVVKPHENWSINGPNGSGKSTLLRLIYGDFTPAFGGVIERIEGQCILSAQEAKNRIGLVSPDLQAAHKLSSRVIEVVASGFFSSIGLIESPTDDQWSHARGLLEAMGLTNLAEQSIAALSYGEVRLIMIARALVNSPSMLLLDEPLEGLDANNRETIRACLDLFVCQGVQVIMVSHHPGDLLDSISNFLEIKEGKIINY
ncbi:MAG: putative ABC transporter ATP-binding protein YlmA [Candidatus Moanabacter tarae]|uniref:Putative ABC transporter ATP-binding protein YlmA n=1 Tax=Candidatus Moanibacter tarae TaxID=2200854 RepID=A0A2Z4AF75_9BACT|nr:MAG: putative ABC transporter ATP-binding protein YlmA [Candidatus Moanabacter tarae]|tara:strand:+ start:3559 stop:5019 length:1461 start_codon:yes stop_codon:yes gene_type:complete